MMSRVILTFLCVTGLNDESSYPNFFCVLEGEMMSRVILPFFVS